MTRPSPLTLAAGAAALIAAIVAALLLGRDGRSDSAPPPAAHPASGIPVAARAAAPLAEDHAPAPRLDYDDDPEGSGRLEGQVIDAEEHPVAGAAVVIDAFPRRESRTEADGSFAFDSLPARIYQVEARAGDAVAGPVSVRLTATAEPVVLRLRPAARVEVTVVDAATGAPLPGALVELRDLVPVTATTDVHGVALLTGVSGGWHTLKAAASGYAAVYQEITAGVDKVTASVDKVTLKLRPGATVGGTVVDIAGRPVEGARVLAESLASQLDPSDARLDAVTTDAKGRWRITALPRVTLRFRASHPRFAPGTSAPVVLADGADPDDVAIVVSPGTRIRGRVVDADGAPVRGAHVRIGGDNEQTGRIRHAYTDGDGRFELLGLPRRPQHLVASAEGATSALVTVDLASRAEVVDLVIHLDLAGSIAGRVVSSSGEEIAEARIVASPELTAERHGRVELRLRGEVSGIADSAGRFRLDGLPPGGYRLRAIRPGAPSAMLAMRLGAPAQTGSTDVTLTVDDVTALAGRVVFAEGGTPASFTVNVGGGSARPFASPDGHFRIDDVPAGDIFVQIAGPEFVADTRTRVTLHAGEVNDLGDVPVQRGRTVSGTVVDAAGSPVAGATVLTATQLDADGWSLLPWHDSAGELQQAVSGADGSFVLHGVGPQRRLLIADHDSAGRSVATTLPAGRGDSRHVLTLQPFAAIQGVVRMGGQPAEAFVALRPHGAVDALFDVHAGPDGTYRFDRIAAGRYLLHGALPRGDALGGSGGSGRTVTVAAGQTATVDIEIEIGDLEVTLQMRSPGDRVEFGFAAIAGVTGEVPRLPATVSEARAMLAAAPTGMEKEGFIVADRRIAFQGLTAGPYVACVVPLPGNPSDPQVLAALQASIAERPVFCRAVRIDADSARRPIVVEVQPR